MTFRLALRKFRIRQGLSVTELARASEVSRVYISSLEHGRIKNIPTPGTIAKLEKGLEIGQGSLLLYSPSYSTGTLQKLCSTPRMNGKVTRLLNSLKDDPSKIDRVLASAIK